MPIGTSRPPEELLPDGGDLAPAPVPTPERVLARDALRLLELLRRDDDGSSPVILGHRAPGVEAVRRQLVPIRTRRALAASYGREAFHARVVRTDDTYLPAGVIRLAYALRWLELGPDPA